METLNLIALWVVIASWACLAAGFLLRKRPPRTTEVRGGTRWAYGVVLQGLGIAVVWGLSRRLGTPILALGPIPDAVLAGIAITLAPVSVFVMVAAQRTLGRHWAYEARLIQHHELITSGPYRFVRHPIYTAFAGLTLATALAKSHWLSLVLFPPLFVAGTILRIHSEERLLRGAFGKAWDDYARRVPAAIPFLR